MGEGVAPPGTDHPESPFMPRPRESGRERREKTEKFQSFNRPKVKIARTSAPARFTSTTRTPSRCARCSAATARSSPRKRTGATAMEQRMIARAVKRARYMALLPYVATTG